MTDLFGAERFTHIPNAQPNEDGLLELILLPTVTELVLPGEVAFLQIHTDHAELLKAHLEENPQTVCVVARDPMYPPHDIDGFARIGVEVALTEISVGSSNRQLFARAQGRRRVELVGFDAIELQPPDEYELITLVRVLPDIPDDRPETQAMRRLLVELLHRLSPDYDILTDEVFDAIKSDDNAGWLSDFAASLLNISNQELRHIIETRDGNERLLYVTGLVSREVSALEVREEVARNAQEEIENTFRQQFLREQLRVIKSELDDDDGPFVREINQLYATIMQAQLPDEVEAKALHELQRLGSISPVAPEVGPIRAYLDWLITLPWHHTTEDNLDLKRAQHILDADHYGLPKIKDRILEHIAVRKLAQNKMKTPILCFVGAPGVGKTSLGKSIARALGREFVRVSLGGVRDEAEIRGHRRTYIGALPGRILQTMRRAGTINPVFMLDEIDKLSADFRGDPESALLEVLDPEQNHEFSDHYLDLDYDLSQVMFITTANDLYPLQDALLDRLEVIEFPGYTEEDKLEIARQFLIPAQLDGHGLDEGIRFEASALETIIREYTYEAGVRNLNREIGAVCRKLARLTAEGKRHPRRINAKHVNAYLGPPTYISMLANTEDAVGIVTGVAWTTGGGDILQIEVSILPGKGNMMLTGQLGDVMQESAQAAMSYLRSRADDLDIPHDDFDNYDVHVHLPEGAIPKDGPSAGITLATALISAFTERKVRSDWAMTGEITLRGKVLPVGGVKEKVLAARRSQINNIILPEPNRKDMIDLPAKAIRSMNILFVGDMQQVMDTVLLPAPEGGRERDQERDDDQVEDGDTA